MFYTSHLPLMGALESVEVKSLDPAAPAWLHEPPGLVTTAPAVLGARQALGIQARCLLKQNFRACVFP